MNNKIYGFGDCGCKYETIHREEFESIPVLYTKQEPVNGEYELEVGKAYKVYVSSGYAFNFKYTVNGTAYTYKLDVTKDAYKNYVMFSVLSVNQSYGLTNDTFKIMYEVDGVRSTKTITLATAYIPVLDERVVVSGASSCYIYDENATIKGLKGDKGDAGDDIEDLGVYPELGALKLTLRELSSGIFKATCQSYTVLVIATAISSALKKFNVIYGDRIMYLVFENGVWTEKSLTIGGE